MIPKGRAGDVYPAYTIPVARPTEEDLRAAALLVVSYSASLEDARDLLGVLGLLPGQEDV